MFGSSWSFSLDASSRRHSSSAAIMWTASIAYGLSLALAVAASPLRDPQRVLSSPSPRDTPTAPIAGLRVAHTARTPYYDPRTGGGHQYNVRHSPLIHLRDRPDLILATHPESAQSLGRTRAAQHHHLGTIERRRSERTGLDRLLAITRSVRPVDNSNIHPTVQV